MLKAARGWLGGPVAVSKVVAGGHLDMPDAQSLHHVRGKDSRRKCATENLLKLTVQPTDPKILEIEIFALEQLRCCNGILLALHLQPQPAALHSQGCYI